MMKVNKSLLSSRDNRMLTRRSPNRRNIIIWIMGFSLCVAALFGNLFELLPQVTYQQQQHQQQDGDFINDVPSSATDDGGRRVLITSAPAATATTPFNTRKKENDDHVVVRNSWLGDYIQFHQNSLEYNSTSHSYKVREDDDNTNTTETKYLIYHCGGNCGGVGDRLKGIFSALYLSICTNRVLLVDAKHPDDLAYYLEPQSIKWNATPPKGYYNNNKFVVAFIDMMDQPYHRFLKDPYQMLIDEPHIANAKIIKLHINTWRPIQFAESKCIQQLQQSQSKSNTNTHLDLSQIYRYFFESLFDWSINVENRVKEYRLMAGMKQQQQQQQQSNNDRSAAAQQQQQQPKKVEQPPFVGVHIRTGPTTAGFKDPPRHVNQEGSFYDCAKKYQTRLKDVCNKNAAADDNPDIFVASDNKESKQKVQKMDDYSTADNNNGNGSTTTTTTVKFVDVDIVHVDKGGNRLVGNLKQLDIWSEMKMLSDSTCLVYSRSGFSETAAWIKNDGCSIRFDDCTTNEPLFEETLQKVKC